MDRKDPMKNKELISLERSISRLRVVAERYKEHPTLTSAAKINRASRISWALLFGLSLTAKVPLKGCINRTLCGHKVCKKVLLIPLFQKTASREVRRQAFLMRVRDRMRMIELLASCGISAVVREQARLLNE